MLSVGGSWLKKKHATVTGVGPTDCQRKGESQGQASGSPSTKGTRSKRGETTHSNRNLTSISEGGTKAPPSNLPRTHTHNEQKGTRLKRWKTTHSKKGHKMFNKIERPSPHHFGQSPCLTVKHLAPANPRRSWPPGCSRSFASWPTVWAHT